MDDLINSGAEAVSDPDGALMVVSAINSIIGGRMFHELFFYYIQVMSLVESLIYVFFNLNPSKPLIISDVIIRIRWQVPPFHFLVISLVLSGKETFSMSVE